MKLSHFLFSSFLSLILFFPPFLVQAITIEISAIVPGCGDGIIISGEQCDSSNLGGASCISQGFTGGSLSCTSACTFNTSLCTLTTSSGGGGGGGGYITPQIPDTNVIFTGRAYPLSRVNILKDGQVILTTISGPDSNFTATISGLSTGNYTFAVYGEDKNNIRSSLFIFPISITSGVTTKIGGIFVPPTIGVDKREVKKGDNIAIFGQSAPGSEITININSEEEFFIKKIADANGSYLLNFDTSILEIGQHHTKSKASLNEEISSSSNILGFFVGEKNVLAKPPTESLIKGDLNNDKHINLVDFSIAAYWYKRSISKAFGIVEAERLNSDGKIDLIDFSIMAFYWTG